MDFGEKLKALRTERGLTQEQLAARLYVSRTAVSKWETGGGSPNLDSLQAVARLFDVSVDDLLSTDDLIVLARDERRSTARSSGMLSFGLLDVLAVVFAFIPLYGVDDGSFVRMANLADYGASVDFGASFAVMAAADTFEVRLKGLGGHAARPNKCVDPIIAGAQIVTALQTIVARNVDPVESAVLSITRFHAGTSADNIIPQTAIIGGTVRTLDEEVRRLMDKRFKDL
ncbi:MAG: helix-turn-helix domain-containing protein, partial [Eggerthella sp.]|nr:helix-turn-helix domain-containing protein [Eggerthella sp.]